MPDYSDTTKGLFENVRLHNVRVMLDLLSEGDLREKEYLRRRYTERARHFDATLAFLKHSDIVDEHGKVLQPTRNGRVAELRGRALPQVLLQRLIEGNSPYRDEVMSYLRQFRVIDGRAVYRPTTEQRSPESELRNFFMELGVVFYDKTNGQYELATDHYSLYLLAVRSASPTRPSEVRKGRKDNEDIGFAAEIAIMGFERERVGKRFADRVRHVAATDASAGYDIESVTVQAEDQLSPRFIEVKAVSPEDYRFYWSANELAMAQSLRSWYHLYLLPTNAHGAFRIELLRIIRDPHIAVLGRPDEWSVEGNVLECKMTGN